MKSSKKLRPVMKVAEQREQSAACQLGGSMRQLELQQKQLDELEAGTRPEQIAAQTAAVAQLDASLKEIEVQIEKSSIIAPFAGRVRDKKVDDLYKQLLVNV